MGWVQAGQVPTVWVKSQATVSQKLLAASTGLLFFLLSFTVSLLHYRHPETQLPKRYVFLFFIFKGCSLSATVLSSFSFCRLLLLPPFIFFFQWCIDSDSLESFGPKTRPGRFFKPWSRNESWTKIMLDHLILQPNENQPTIRMSMRKIMIHRVKSR